MKHNIVSVSGGKDSTALLLLAIERQAENLQPIFADTGHEHPQTYEYVQYLSEKVYPIRTVRADFSEEIQRRREFLQQIADGTAVDNRGQRRWDRESAARCLEHLHPTGNPFVDLTMLKGFFPTSFRRFCSEKLKRDPVMEQVLMPLMDGESVIWNWQGVRADESDSRAKLPEMDEVGGGLWNYRPILRWTAEDCFALHRKHGIKHNPLYEQGMRRVGCMPCIHSGKDELLEISRRFPEEIKRVAEWEQKVSLVQKRGAFGATFFHADKGGAILDAVEWAKTSRGGRQLDFLRVLDQTGPVCSSVYGLCE
jgi:3'-phosphoadenosine 5'-phosphosulfate sulfotransferase (PAPS reductase)/FAD synthetase